MMQLPPYSDSFHVARLSLTRSLTHSVEPRTGALFDHCCAEYYFTIAFIMGYVYYISLFLFVNYLRSFCMTLLLASPVASLEECRNSD